MQEVSFSYISPNANNSLNIGLNFKPYFETFKPQVEKFKPGFKRKCAL